MKIRARRRGRRDVQSKGAIAVPSGDGANQGTGFERITVCEKLAWTREYFKAAERFQGEDVGPHRRKRCSGNWPEHAGDMDGVTMVEIEGEDSKIQIAGKPPMRDVGGPPESSRGACERSADLAQGPHDVLGIKRPYEQRALMAAGIDHIRRLGVGYVIDRVPGDALGDH